VAFVIVFFITNVMPFPLHLFSNFYQVALEGVTKLTDLWKPSKWLMASLLQFSFFLYNSFSIFIGPMPNRLVVVFGVVFPAICAFLIFGVSFCHPFFC